MPITSIKIELCIWFEFINHTKCCFTCQWNGASNHPFCQLTTFPLEQNAKFRWHLIRFDHLTIILFANTDIQKSQNVADQKIEIVIINEISRFISVQRGLIKWQNQVHSLWQRKKFANWWARCYVNIDISWVRINIELLWPICDISARYRLTVALVFALIRTFSFWFLAPIPMSCVSHSQCVVFSTHDAHTIHESGDWRAITIKH